MWNIILEKNVTGASADTLRQRAQRMEQQNNEEECAPGGTFSFSFLRFWRLALCFSCWVSGGEASTDCGIRAPRVPPRRTKLKALIDERTVLERRTKEMAAQLEAQEKEARSHSNTPPAHVSLPSPPRARPCRESIAELLSVCCAYLSPFTSG